MMEILKKILKKLSSRKFLMAVGGIASGLMLIINNEVTEGATVICTSVVAYLAAEGIIDYKAVGGNSGGSVQDGGGDS